MGYRTGIFAIRRRLCVALGSGAAMSRRAKLIVALTIIVVSYTTKALHAVDLEQVMYTTDQPFSGLTELYDARAISIINGDGLLGPYHTRHGETIWLSQAPGYSMYLSGAYSMLGRDFFRVQLVQNALNSISAVLLFLIGGSLLGWRVGAVSGLLAALSHHLGYISNFILPDSLCALPLLGAIYLLVIARRGRLGSYWLHGSAGVLVGLSAWLRPQGMLVGPVIMIVLAIVSNKRWEVWKRAGCMTLVSFLTIAPITIRNRVVYGAVLPINLGVGLNLWEGIAEASGDRFGAESKDDEVAEQEAALYDNPRYRFSSYTPDGIQRDRDRTEKSLNIIRAHPFWYAGVMLDRMRDMLKYSAYAALVASPRRRGSAEEAALNKAAVKQVWEQLAATSTAAPVGHRLSWLRWPTRALQRATKETMLAFIVIGAVVVAVASRRRLLLLSMVPLYYLLFQSFMHTEFRYTLPMHYFLFVFASCVWVLLGYALWSGIKALGLKLSPAQFS